MSRSADLAATLRGFRKVFKALGDLEVRQTTQSWANSSIRVLVYDGCRKMSDSAMNRFQQQNKLMDTIGSQITNIGLGASQLIRHSVSFAEANMSYGSKSTLDDTLSGVYDIKTSTDDSNITSDPFLREDMLVESLTSEGITTKHDIPKSKTHFYNTKELFGKGVRHFHFDSSEQLSLEDLEKLDAKSKKSHLKSTLPLKKHASRNMTSLQKPIGHFTQSLSPQSKESKVPGTRIGRLMSFAGLAAGLGAGVLAEATKRGLGLKDTHEVLHGTSHPLLSGTNAERIVGTLCRVRGAALKLGQMLSIQGMPEDGKSVDFHEYDNSLVNPELQKVFERVRNSADFMPAWQMEKVLVTELGDNWQDKIASFEKRPFAAASIGQVHRATLHDGTEVAMKIQYPGVADSIDSDINNLKSVLSLWQILPEGLYVDQAMKVARKELALECDYVREAQCLTKFRGFLEHDPLLYVPALISDLTTKRVITTELVNGKPIDKVSDQISQDKRNELCKSILDLCLKEVFVFRFMQTDPNWSNFLYDETTGRVSLLDFGASRGFDKTFTDLYLKSIHAASVQDRDSVLKYSRQLGFLTGYESKVMENAHINTVMILGEAFSPGETFDFSTQNTASRVQNLIPVMLRHRLTPPPEESYSLHRKLAGCFLLCTKLKAKIDCYSMFADLYRNYVFNDEDSHNVQQNIKRT